MPDIVAETLARLEAGESFYGDDALFDQTIAQLAAGVSFTEPVDWAGVRRTAQLQLGETRGWGAAAYRPIGTTLEEVESSMPTGPTGYKGFFGNIGERWQRGMFTGRFDMLLQAAKGKPDAERYLMHLWDEYQERLGWTPAEGESWFENALLDAAGALPMLARGFGEWWLGAKEGALIAMAVGAAIPAPEEVVTAPSAAAIGGFLRGFQYMQRRNEGSLYREMLTAGIDRDVADRTSFWASIPYGLIEYSQFVGFGAAGKAITGLATRGMVKAGVEGARRAAGQQLLAFAGNVAAESLEESLQRATEVIAMNVAANIHNMQHPDSPVQPPSLADLPHQMIDEFTRSIGTMTVLSLLSGGVQMPRALQAAGARMTAEQKKDLNLNVAAMREMQAAPTEVVEKIAAGGTSRKDFPQDVDLALDPSQVENRRAYKRAAPYVVKQRLAAAGRMDEAAEQAAAEERLATAPPVGSVLIEPPDQPGFGTMDWFIHGVKYIVPSVDMQQMDALRALVNARAQVRGQTPEQFIATHFADFQRLPASAMKGYAVKSGFAPRAKLKAVTEFMEDGRAVIRAFESADLKTVVHELAHVFQRDMTPSESAAFIEWAGAWDRAGQEKFATGFVKYLQTGEAPTFGLRRVFEKFREWLTALWKGAASTVVVPESIARAYDALFGVQTVDAGVPALRAVPAEAPVEAPVQARPARQLAQRRAVVAPERVAAPRRREAIESEISSLRDVLERTREKDRSAKLDLLARIDSLREEAATARPPAAPAIEAPATAETAREGPAGPQEPRGAAPAPIAPQAAPEAAVRAAEAVPEAQPGAVAPATVDIETTLRTALARTEVPNAVLTQGLPRATISREKALRPRLKAQEKFSNALESLWSALREASEGRRYDYPPATRDLVLKRLDAALRSLEQFRQAVGAPKGDPRWTTMRSEVNQATQDVVAAIRDGKIQPPAAPAIDVKKGQKFLDMRTAMTLTVQNVVRPRGGNIAWIEAVDRVGNIHKIDPADIGTRYAGNAPDLLAEAAEPRKRVRKEDLTEAQQKLAKELHSRIAIARKQRELPDAANEQILDQFKSPRVREQWDIETLYRILEAVENEWPKHIITKKGDETIKTPVVSKKQAAAIQAYRKATGISNEDFEAIVARVVTERGKWHELHGKGSTDTYVNAGLFITPREADRIIHYVRNHAFFNQHVVAAEKARAAKPEIAARFDALVAVAQQRYEEIAEAAKKKGKKVPLFDIAMPFFPKWRLRIPFELFDIRYTAGRLAEVSGRWQFFHLVQRLIDTHLAGETWGNKFWDTMIETVGPKEFHEVVRMELADRTVEKIIINDNPDYRTKIERGDAEWQALRIPDNATPAQFKAARALQDIFARIQNDIRAGKFMSLLQQASGQIEQMLSEPVKKDWLPNAPDDAIREAHRLYQEGGIEKARTFLDNQSWGVIHEGYVPGHAPLFFMFARQLAPHTVVSASHMEVRQDFFFDPEGKTVFQHLNSYLYQVHNKLHMQPLLYAFDVEMNRLHKSLPQLAHWDRIDKAMDTFIRELLGHPVELGPAGRLMMRMYSQAMTAVLWRPALITRNALQTAAQATHPLRWVFGGPPLSEERYEYVKAFVWEDQGLKRDYFYMMMKPFPGLRWITEVARTRSPYMWVDRMLNRTRMAVGEFHAIDKQVAEFGESPDALFEHTALKELEPMQQAEALSLLARDGLEAFKRYVVKETVANVQFIYDRAQRAPIEHGAPGRILMNLVNFQRQYFQRLYLQARKLQSGQATHAEKFAAAQVWGAVLVKGTLVGMLSSALTGKKRNPYAPWEMVQWSPGGFLLSGAQEVADVFSNTIQVMSGDVEARDRLTRGIPNMADVYLPFFSTLFDVAEAMTERKSIPQQMLRELRALIDREYKVARPRYRVERTFIEGMQKALFGSHRGEERVRKPVVSPIEAVQRKLAGARR